MNNACVPAYQDSGIEALADIGIAITRTNNTPIMFRTRLEIIQSPGVILLISVHKNLDSFTPSNKDFLLLKNGTYAVFQQQKGKV